MGFVQENTIKNALLQSYDQAIDHALQIVGDAYLGFDEDVMLKGKYTNSVFMHMIDQLKKLKSVQPSDPPPIPDGIIPLKGTTDTDLG